MKEKYPVLIGHSARACKKLFTMEQVDNLASIDSVVTIKKACEDADFYEAYPSNNSLDDKIKLYVGYLKNSSGILDVDYAVKTIFS